MKVKNKKELKELINVETTIPFTHNKFDYNVSSDDIYFTTNKNDYSGINAIFSSGKIERISDSEPKNKTEFVNVVYDFIKKQRATEA